MTDLHAKRYSAYKESGVEWLGEVPAHWDVKHLKALAEIKGGKDSSAVEVEDDGYPVYGSGGVFGKASKYLYNKPSVLLGRKGTIDKPIFVTEPFWPVDTIFFTDIKNSVEPKFFYYMCLNIHFGLYKYGSAVPSMASTVLSRILFVVPKRAEQTAIAAYLDTKTAQIDRQVELLNKKATQYGKLKQSLINETVIRGLNSSVPMKESGVEWIGQVPSHWKILRGKDIFEQTKNKAGLVSSSYDVLSLTLKGVIKRDLDNMKGKIPASFDGYQIANPGNLVLCLFDMDVTPRIVGFVNQLGIITSAYTVLRGLKNVDMKYFLYYYLEQNRNGSLLANSKTLRSTMTYDLFSQLQLPVPPITEQTAIAAYLDEKTAQIDRIFSTISTQIDKLKELRKTLINDVVTGKIKVI